MSVRATRPTILLFLAVGAGLYFAYASRLSLEYLDEGHIVYPSWAVAEGAMPYRDFRQVYGPALFFLNGALLRWLGADVMSIRLFLVVMKALLSVVVFMLANSLSATPFALLAWAWFVVAWGSPNLFNVPYANHYSLALALVGLLAFLRARDRFLVGCALAGVCFGTAATFKQTTGLFALVSFLLFLLVRSGESRSVDGSHGMRVPAWLARPIALAVPLAALALFVVYAWPRDTPGNFLVIVAPAATVAVVSLARALRAEATPQSATAAGILFAGSAFAIPPLVFAAFYAAQGLLPELVFNLVRGLPQMVTWFVPLALPGTRSLAAMVAAATCIAAVGLARHRSASLALAAVAAAAAVLFVQRVNAARGWSAYFSGPGWYGDLLRCWVAVPLATLGLTALTLRRKRHSVVPLAGSRNPPEDRDALRLLSCHAAVSLLSLYPAGDVFHAIMILPSYLPLIAHLGERYVASADVHGGAPAGMRRASRALAVGAIALLAWPSVKMLLDSRRAASNPGLRRAKTISGPQPLIGEVARLVADLEQRDLPRRAMLVTTGEQMLYFLSDRRSVAEHDEYVFYLVAADVISAEDARRLVDEAALSERLASVKPLVIDRGGPESLRFRKVFAQLSRTIDSHYAVAADIGRYRILEWKQ